MIYTEIGCVYAIVGAASVVTHDVEDYEVVVGIPARVIKAGCRQGSTKEKEAAEIMNENQLNQRGHALYSYCKVMRVPKLGAYPVVVTVLAGLILILIFTALGESLLTAMVIGASVSAVLAFLCWLAYRYRVGASKRLNSYLAVDGGQSMISDFASA